MPHLRQRTSNIAGLKVGGTVGELWSNRQDVAEGVIDDIILLQQALTDEAFDKQQLIDAMLEAFDGDPEHKCMGRSAPARLERALQLAEQFGLDVPYLRTINNEI